MNWKLIAQIGIKHEKCTFADCSKTEYWHSCGRADLNLCEMDKTTT